MQARDMTKREFDAAVARLGFRPQGFMGYYGFELPGDGTRCVSVENAGPRRRDRLAYLIAQKAKAECDAERELQVSDGAPQ